MNRDVNLVPKAFDGLFSCDAAPWNVDNEDAGYISWSGICDGHSKMVALVVSDEPGDEQFESVKALLCAAPDLLRVLDCLLMAIHPDKSGIDLTEARRVVASAKSEKFA